MGSRVVGAGFCDEMTSEQTQMSEAGARGWYGVRARRQMGGRGKDLYPGGGTLRFEKEGCEKQSSLGRQEGAEQRAGRGNQAREGVGGHPRQAPAGHGMREPESPRVNREATWSDAILLLSDGAAEGEQTAGGSGKLLRLRGGMNGGGSGQGGGRPQGAVKRAPGLLPVGTQAALSHLNTHLHRFLALASEASAFSPTVISDLI